MYSDFAYSHGMQIILLFQTLLTNTCIMYLISNLILLLANEQATRNQKLTFAFWAGAIIHTAFIYCAYLIGGMVAFSPVVYILIVNHNPLAGFLCCILGIKVLRLSPIRSIKVMVYFYIYFIFIVNINRVLTALWPIGTVPSYNYLQDSLLQIVYFVSVILIYRLTKELIKRKKLIIRFSDKVFIDIKKEWLIYFFKMFFLYALTALLPLLIHNEFVAGAIIILLLIFFLIFNIIYDLFALTRAELENSKVHISSLSNSINEFRGVKHDFYNILHTYSGYLEIGDLDRLKIYHSSLIRLTSHAGTLMEMSQKMEENPALVSMLLSMTEKAEKANLEMIVSLQCDLKNLYIDNFNICRCLTCLLDNAIEAAAESRQKKVFFTLESKENGSKLIIITNSTAIPMDTATIENAGFSTKPGHHGFGLFNVRRIIEKYGNCTFRMTYFNYEVSSYIELRPSKGSEAADNEEYGAST